MAEKTEREIKLDGKPYFIRETVGGIFHVANKIIELPNGWNYEFDEEVGSLELDKDIREIPTHGLALLIRYNSHDFQGEYIVAELRKFARLAWYDYVGFESFGANFAARPICNKGDEIFVEVRPRLFRDIREKGIG